MHGNCGCQRRRVRCVQKADTFLPNIKNSCSDIYSKIYAHSLSDIKIELQASLAQLYNNGNSCILSNLLQCVYVSTSCQTERVCVQLPTSAVNVALLAFAAQRRSCSNRSISPARRAHSSKPASAECGRQTMEQTDGQTDGRTDTRPLRRPFTSAISQRVPAVCCAHTDNLRRQEICCQWTSRVDQFTCGTAIK